MIYWIPERIIVEKDTVSLENLPKAAKICQNPPKSAQICQNPRNLRKTIRSKSPLFGHMVFRIFRMAIAKNHMAFLICWIT
jgi:hypothetical protein